MRTPTNTLFGELRSLLQQPASAHQWQALTAHLDRWPDDAFEELALGYAADHLVTWPDDLRVAPPSWIADAHDRDRGGQPRMRLCRHLRVDTYNKTLAALARLLASPHVAHLTSLDLGHWNMSADQLLRVMRDAQLLALRELELASNPFGPDGARVLSELPCLAQLTDLYLVQCQIGPDGVEHLMRSPHLKRLRALSLRLNNLQDRGCAALAHHTFHELYLGDNKISDDGLIALCESTRLGALRALSLDRNQITARGVRALLSPASAITGLEHLNLSHNHLDDEALSLIAASPRLVHLDTLRLAFNRNTDKGEAALARSPHLSAAIRAEWDRARPTTELTFNRDFFEPRLDALLVRMESAPQDPEHRTSLWWELHGELETWPDGAWSAVWLPRIARAVASWPDEIKSLHWSWFEPMLSGEPPSVGVGLCTMLALEYVAATHDAPGLIAALERPELANLRILYIGAPDEPFMRWLTASQHAQRLHTLSIYADELDMVARVLAETRSMPALRALHLRAPALPVEIAQLTAAPWLAQLDTLELQSHVSLWPDHLLDALLAAPALPDHLRDQLRAAQAAAPWSSDWEGDLSDPDDLPYDDPYDDDPYDDADQLALFDDPEDVPS